MESFDPLNKGIVRANLRNSTAWRLVGFSTISCFSLFDSVLTSSISRCMVIVRYGSGFSYANFLFESNLIVNRSKYCLQRYSGNVRILRISVESIRSRIYHYSSY